MECSLDYTNPAIQSNGRVYTHKDLTGLRVGRLVVVKLLGRRLAEEGRPLLMWLCKCDCGAETSVAGVRLSKGYTLSCGCLKKEKQIEYATKPEGWAAKNQLLSSYKSNAKKRGLVWLISTDEFYELATSRCHYCGSPPTAVEKSRSNTGDFIHGGIDRIDSNKGYIPGNVVPSCTICNFAKSNHSYEDFILWLDRLVSFRKSA